MYESFFGLTGPAFRLIPDPSFLFQGKGHRDAFAALQVGLAAGAKVMVLTGEVGAGKTTLVQALLASVDPVATVKAHISAARLDAETLCERLCEALGVARQANAIARRDMLLAALASSPRATLLVIDEAQHLAPGALDLLDNLARATDLAPLPFQVCLVGQPELRILLNAGPRRDFRELISVDRHLPPLERGEIRLYVEHRLHRAGWTGRPEFEDAAFTEIFIFTAGNPRRVNLLCNSLMLCACLKKQHVIDAAAVTWAAAAMREDLLQGGPDLLDLGAHFERRPTLTEAFEPDTQEFQAPTGHHDGPPIPCPTVSDLSAPGAMPRANEKPAPPSRADGAGDADEEIRLLEELATTPPARSAHAADEPVSPARGDEASHEVAAVPASSSSKLPHEMSGKRRRRAVLASAASVALALALLAYFVFQHGAAIDLSQRESGKVPATSTTAPVSPPTAVDSARRGVGSVAPDSSVQPAATDPQTGFTSGASSMNAAMVPTPQDGVARGSVGRPVPGEESALPEPAVPAGSAATASPTPACSGPAFALGLCDDDSPSTRRQ